MASLGRRSLLACGASACSLGVHGFNIDPPRYVAIEQALGTANSLLYDRRRSRIFDTSSRMIHDPDIVLGGASQQLSLLKNLPEHSVLCVGEEHNHPMHHAAELQLLKAMQKETSPGVNLTLGLEMFYNIKDHSKALDDFVFGTDSLDDLKRRTDWEATWGWPMYNYAKLLNYAKAERIRVVGLNAPERVSKFVKEHGVGGLLGKPKFPELDFSNQEHLSRFLAGPLVNAPADCVLDARGVVHSALPQEIRLIYEEQVLREEWMATAIASHSRDVGGHFLAILGRSHIEGRRGVPDRVHRRLGAKDGERAPPITVLLQGASWDSRGQRKIPILEEVPGPSEADWVWYLEHKKGCPI